MEGSEQATIDLNVKPTALTSMAALLAYVATLPETEIWTDASCRLGEGSNDEEDYEYQGDEGENPELGFLRDILMTIAGATRSVATIPAAVTALVPAAPATALRGDDAELLALGPQVDEIFVRFYAVKAVVDPSWRNTRGGWSLK